MNDDLDVAGLSRESNGDLRFDFDAAVEGGGGEGGGENDGVGGGVGRNSHEGVVEDENSMDEITIPPELAVFDPDMTNKMRHKMKMLTRGVISFRTGTALHLNYCILQLVQCSMLVACCTVLFYLYQNFV